MAQSVLILQQTPPPVNALRMRKMQVVRIGALIPAVYQTARILAPPFFVEFWACFNYNTRNAAASAANAASGPSTGAFQ
ncbi:MAG: hypothetical protein C4520_08195 [Candidatus Abyssobacteria bacterium SURF_5]|uniref:Uncharacterized protein n=1 Tax=Abyssobacteria bacterium (strain SURF_5) TaxID=2093360 RepID=A0A3A4NPG5_ABYX5|nr:MAG: hypothetical protein C4520_08195 [Candidatus Abyssubacteria bacterium SURF_5]